LDLRLRKRSVFLLARGFLLPELRRLSAGLHVSFDYAKLAQTSSRLLNRFGKSVTLRNQATGTYDPATGTNAQGAPTDVPAFGAMFEFDEGVTTFNGEEIQKDDKRLLLEASSVEPSTEDQIVFDGTVYNIMGIKKTAPAGIVVLYELHLRK
jgi:hypothetical protein